MMGSSKVQRAILIALAAGSVSACNAMVATDAAANNSSGNGAQTAGATFSGLLPVVVPLPPNPPSPLSVRPNFDEFSWASFIALNWPVDPNQRGAPLNPNNSSTFTGAGNSYATVWGSYRDVFELYTGPIRPVPFDGPDGTPPACGAPGRMTLLMGSKVGSLLTDGDEAFSYPLVDQNNNYIYYDIRFNRDQYNFIRGNDNDQSTWLYRARNLMAAEQAGPIQMPWGQANPYMVGALMVKSAWRQLTPNEDASRYFTMAAQVYDPTVTPAVCRNVTVGLIGLHIAHKLMGQPQWVWSSFEQVDNVPPDTGTPGHLPMTLNNNSNNPQTQGGWANRPASQQLVPESLADPGDPPEPDPDDAGRPVHGRHQQSLPGRARRHALGELPAGDHAMAVQSEPVQDPREWRHLSGRFGLAIPGQQRGEHGDGDLFPVAARRGRSRRQQLHAMPLQRRPDRLQLDADLAGQLTTPVRRARNREDL